MRNDDRRVLPRMRDTTRDPNGAFLQETSHVGR